MLNKLIYVVKFLEHFAISKPAWPPYPASLFGTSASFSTLQTIGHISGKKAMTKEKLVEFGCLEKGEEKSITSDDETSIC